MNDNNNDNNISQIITIYPSVSEILDRYEYHTVFVPRVARDPRYDELRILVSIDEEIKPGKQLSHSKAPGKEFNDLDEAINRARILFEKIKNEEAEKLRRGLKGQFEGKKIIIRREIKNIGPLPFKFEVNRLSLSPDASSLVPPASILDKKEVYALIISPSSPSSDNLSPVRGSAELSSKYLTSSAGVVTPGYSITVRIPGIKERIKIESDSSRIERGMIIEDKPQLPGVSLFVSHEDAVRAMKELYIGLRSFLNT